MKAIKDLMRQDGFIEKTVYKAIRETGVDHFYCKHYGEVGEKGECGAFCKEYRPRNGKSGNCTHNGYCYERGEKLTIKIDQ